MMRLITLSETVKIGGEKNSLITNLVNILFEITLVSLTLFATACSGLSKPKVEQSSIESVSNTPERYSTDQSALLPKISAGQQLRFENISTEEGLSQGTVTAILQDRLGFMWFGTEGGLNKYDGYEFSIFKHDSEDPKSLSDSLVYSIFEDRGGNLWIGTRVGLNRLDRKTGTFEHFQLSDDSDGLVVLAISQDRSGNIWVGTEGGGLVVLDLPNNKFTDYKHNPDDPKSLSNNTIHEIFTDQEGLIWIGTDRGLNRFDPVNGSFVQNFSESHTLHDVPVYSINEDNQGALWVGTQQGLYQWNRAEDQLIEYLHDPNNSDSISNDTVRYIFKDSQNRLWIGTRSGLNLYDETQKRFFHYIHNPNNHQSLISDSIRTIYEDRSGVIWVGTASGGISKYAPATQKFGLYTYTPGLPNNLSDNNIWSIYEDHNGVLWIGTFSTGLNKLDRASGTVKVYQNNPEISESLSNDDIRSILEDRNGNLWIGTEYGGLNQFDPKNETFVHYRHNPDKTNSLSSDRVFVIFEDSLGNLWIGTQGGGLNQLDPYTGDFTNFQHDPTDPSSLSDDDVRAIYEDRSGILWIGTLGGLNLYDGQTNSFTAYQHEPDNPSSLSSDFVASIYEDSQGTVWVGTFGGGLNRFDRATRSFTQFTDQDGLPDNTVFGIIEGSGGTLWISTNNGLSKFNPHQETFRNYDVSDGLQGNQFNPGAFFQSKNGELFFGGTQGLNTFIPGQVIDNPVPPPLVITAFDVFNQTVKTDIAHNERIELSYRDSFISFDFAALDYNASEKNLYAYKLDGIDKDWVSAGTRRYANYTHLPGGNYVFRVLGSNNDGIWNETGTQVQITITPPFWVTWWFRGILLVVLLGGAFSGYRLRVRSLEAHSQELESQVGQRTAELMQVQETLRQRELEKAISEERSRLARELHDSVTQSLHSSTLLAEAGQRLAGSGDVERARGYLVRLGDITQQALKEMRLLVYELRPLALREIGLASALEQRLDTVERRAGVDANLNVEQRIELPSNIEEEFFRIASEALNNAMKHANPTTVTVSLRIDENSDVQFVELEITDDGKGFDPDKKDKGGLGLFTMEERITKLGGKLTILSTPGKGTQVKARVDLE
jgi:ligand-binding sensor domain-containing protein/signal transduction histidine kinase